MRGSPAIRISSLLRRSSFRLVLGSAIDDGEVLTDDHRAAAVIDDVDRDLPSHAGAAADNNDLLGRKMHIRDPFLALLDGSAWTAALRIDDA